MALDPSLASLAVCLRATQVPATQKQGTRAPVTDISPLTIYTLAEAQLSQLDATVGYSITLLKLLQEPSLDKETRLAAAITFKNFVKLHWRKEKEVAEQDRVAIKTHIVTLMLSAPPYVQKLLSESLSIISDADFPSKWQTLLPELLDKMKGGDFAIINGVLATLHSIFRRYQAMYKSNAVLTELKYVLEQFGVPLLQLYQATVALVDQAAANPALLHAYFLALYRMTKIFYSLSFIDLPSQFEERLNDWALLFRKLLQYRSTQVELVGADKEKPGFLHKLQGAICKVAVLYTEKYDDEDEFRPHVPGFVADVWMLLTTLSTDQKYDKLVADAISFLNQVSLNTNVAFKLLSDPDTLQKICQNVIVPNVEFRAADEELFEDDPQEYIKRDIEGSDSDTRRRSACEFVRGLRKCFEKEVTAILATYIQHLLATYAADPKKNWKAKDAALYLVTALAVSAGTEGQGVVEVNPLVEIVPFFGAHVLPELQPKSHPVLQADALKFATTFRRQLDKTSALSLFPLFGGLVSSPNYVVHSYAALCIERYLSLQDGHVPRYTKEDIKPHLQGYIGGFFTQLGSSQSKDNEYIIRGLMRTIITAKEDCTPFAQNVLTWLCQILGATAENQTNPNFTHYLFETIGALVKAVCTPQPALVPAVEPVLLAPFQLILAKDISELEPYVFQVLSLLLELGPQEISPFYATIFPSLLTPQLWMRTANVPALVRLLQAYIRKAGAHIGADQKQFVGLLGVFQKLVSSSVNDHEGFYVLESIVEFVPYKDFQPHLTEILNICFRRLQSMKTVKFIKNFVTFLALFIGKHNGALVISSIDAIQGRLFRMVLESLWLPHVQKVTGVLERKMCAIAMVKLLTDTPNMLTPDYLPLWPRLLEATIRLFEAPAEATTAEEDAAALLEVDDEPGYSATFAPLAYAGKTDTDPFKEIPSAPVFLAQSLHKASQQMPGKFGPMIQALQPSAQTSLQQYLAAAGIPAPYIL